MTELAVVLGLLVAPLLPLAFSHPAGLERVRDYWLRGAALAAILVAPLPLAPVAAWWAWRWPTVARQAGSERAHLTLLGALVIWVAIGIGWVALARLEPTWWPWMAAGWVAWGCGQVGLMAYRAYRGAGWRGFGRRQTGTFGTPAMTALYLALVTPFVPWWLWPVWAVGLWLVCSWAAFLAIGAGAVVYFVPWRG